MKTMKNPTISDEIRKMELFSAADDAVISTFAKKTNINVYKDQQTLFLSGDSCDTLYIILSGGIYLYFISEEGNEVIFSDLQPGDAVGEIEFALNYRHSSNAAICGTTRLLEIDRKTFNELSAIPQVSSYLMRTIARKLHRTIMFAEGMALYPLETRLARLLLNLGASHGRSTSDGILIEKSISQSRMGQLINASRPRINAQLQAWKSERLIGVRQHRIVIFNKRSLQIISRHSDPAA
ncbi:Cyclic AMP receptor protein,catabolite gene activator [Neorhizobium galegae bv. officinalis bv. officinalis str. HAMBI 1141]|uniref:Cyclic AMP receptor protein,catabolite gene activator n=1 Tax=Neorhizobium galegae bv. officinalis bv. officinalis str. HAMBI 1141 TaxID=1028801 RepID=A0A068T5R2_NEOGA|nr:Crp/Fnr family transcriptional regulator [Neorhizobium galegae]CDN53404.1 Cyclic AMP receptor protein,catabolite gene activator [Neorhizobium galegae bv. officinalis bv. officinalis str. HAMBI 1141]